jgi:hypothetical protein
LFLKLILSFPVVSFFSLQSSLGVFAKCGSGLHPHLEFMGLGCIPKLKVAGSTYYEYAAKQSGVTGPQGSLKRR